MAHADPQQRASAYERFSRHRHPYLMAAVVFVVLCVVNAVLQPTFLRYEVAVSNVAAFLPMALLAVGQTYVILAADIDLSTGAIVSVVNVGCVTIIETMGGTGASIALGFAAGLFLGVALRRRQRILRRRAAVATDRDHLCHRHRVRRVCAVGVAAGRAAGAAGCLPHLCRHGAGRADRNLDSRRGHCFCCRGRPHAFLSGAACHRWAFRRRIRPVCRSGACA